MPDPIVNAQQLRIAQGIGTLPANPDDSGREPVSSSPVDGQLQQPAQAPAQQPMQLQPAQPATPAQPPTSNPKLFGFIGSVLHGTLRALAGPPMTAYSTDSSGRVIRDPNQPVDTVGAQGRRLAAHALEGLAAGAAVQQPRYGSKASALASGLGAGAAAQAAAARAAGDKARGQAREDFEAQQRTILQKHEIAKGNALLATTWQHFMDTEQDRDPARAQHLSWAKAAEDAGVPVKYVTESDAQQLRASDPHFLATWQVLPVGLKAVTDAEGNPVLDADGKPHQEGQFALINGLHDGNLNVPASFVSDVKQYAKYAGATDADTLKEGDEVSMQHFIKLANAVQEGKKKEQQGWEKPKDGWAGADGKTPVQINSVTGEQRPYPTGVTPNIKNEPAESAATVKEKNAKAAKDQKDAANAGNSNLTGEDYLKTLPVARQGMVRAVGEGRQVLPANRKEALAILADVQQSYPDFDESKAKTWQKTRNEYTGSGKVAQSLVRANTAMAHAKALYDETTADAVLNPFSKAHQDREITLGLLKDEIGAAVKGGIVTEGEGKDLFDRLGGGLTVGAKRERIAEVTRRLHDRIEESQTTFAAAAPSSAVKVPSLLSPQAALAYDYVQSGGKAQPAQNPQSGQAQNQTPAPTTHSVSIATAIKNHPGMTEDQVRAWAKQNNYEVVQ
jgi:hypothetical protein